MRKNIGFVLVGLAGALLLMGLVAVTWAPGVAKRTPLDTDSLTILEGEGALSTSGDLNLEPIEVASITQADVERSDEDVVVFKRVSCVVIQQGDPATCVDGEDPRLITASEGAVAVDRRTAAAVNNEKYDLPEDTPRYEGLINKWPFDAEKKDYDYWDGLLERTVTATYDREEKVKDLDAYVYTVDIDQEPAEIAEGVDGTYTNQAEIYIEPRTGSIINQEAKQERFLEDGTQVLEINAQFTEESVDEAVSDAEDNISQLTLLTQTVPLVGFIGGAILLVAGLFLVFGARRQH